MQNTIAVTNNVQQHYGRRNLGNAILTQLKNTGKDIDNLKVEDLAPMDEFHIRGIEATIEMAEKLNLDYSTSLLDAGCGIGGAARYLANTYGCKVTGLDLTEEYINTAQMLTERAALSSYITYQQGDAVDMPFDDDSFDVVWTQHAQMNINDKENLYKEIYRVLKPGGTFAFYDILAGPGGSIHFPVLWASKPELSFLINEESLKRVLEKRGFEIKSWVNKSEDGLTAFQERLEKIRLGIIPIVGINVLVGNEFKTMSENIVRNLIEKRIIIIEGIAKKPA